MSLIKSVFKDFKIGNVDLRFPADLQGPYVSDSVLKTLTSTPAEARKVQAIVDELQKHNIGISLVGLTRTEDVYLGDAEYPKNYFCKRMCGGSWQTMVLNKHFMLIVGDLENPQLVYDGRHVYTAASKRNASRFLSMPEAEQAKFLAGVKVQMPLL